LSYKRLLSLPDVSSVVFAIIYNMAKKRARRTPMRIFIVDDSKVVLDRLADLLKEEPETQLVGHAGDVSDAIGGILRAKPDALILDLQMPGGSGLDVLRAVRMDQPHLAVLICTNYPYSQFREECLRAGADFFLDKSTEFEKIPAILRGLSHKESKVSSGSR
jgi:DNA-binding NarL/FixJ family response regulator